MKKYIPIFFLLLSCTQSKTNNEGAKETDSIPSKVSSSVDSIIAGVELPKLYVNYFRDTLYEGLSEWEVDSIVVVNTEYFKIPLLKDKRGYTAMSDSSQPLSEKRSVRFLTYVVANYPTYSGPASFNSSQEFLTHMSERGYEKITQSKGGKEVIYTFKKKIRN